MKQLFGTGEILPSGAGRTTWSDSSGITSQAIGADAIS